MSNVCERIRLRFFTDRVMTFGSFEMLFRPRR